MVNLYNIGVNVGGSKISCAYVDKTSGMILRHTLMECEIDSNMPIDGFVEALHDMIKKVIEAADGLPYYGVGVAIPGPLDYERGISKITGVHKFDALFGLNLKQIIKDLLGAKEMPICFANDANCFALGEYFQGAACFSQRTIVITLGTGIGSAFLIDGRLQTREDAGVPIDGYLYWLPYRESIADDYFSKRWLLNSWKEKTGEEIKMNTLADLAKENNTQALSIFEEFSNNLVQFVSPWIEKFKPDTLLFGGSISKVAPFLISKLEKKLAEKGYSTVKIKSSKLWDESPMIGAAMYTKMKGGRGYDKNERDYETMQTWISDRKTVMIDGYAGVNWDLLAEKIHQGLISKGKRVRWFFSDAAMKSPEEMANIPEKSMKDWFNIDTLSQIQPDDCADINVVIGCGAALTHWNGSLMYIDLPKNERKSLMLVDANWKLMDDYKFEILSSIDLYIR